MSQPQVERNFLRGRRDFLKFCTHITKYDTQHGKDPVLFMQPLADNSILPTLNYFPVCMSSIDSAYEVMHRYNVDGYGCHFALHEFGSAGKMDKGRVSENCSRVRCYCVDVDSFIEVSEIEKICSYFNPSLVVASSRMKNFGYKTHVYWMLDVSDERKCGVLLESWGDIQLALAYKMDEFLGVKGVSDKGIRSLSKTLRLPGFLHQKDLSNIFLSRIVYASLENKITAESLRDWFKGLGVDGKYIEKCHGNLQQKKKKIQNQNTGITREVKAQKSEIDGFQSRYLGAEEGSRNQTLMAYVSELFCFRHFSFNEALGAALVENKLANVPPLDKGEVEKIVHSRFENWKDSLTLGLQRRIQEGDSLCAKRLFNEDLQQEHKGCREQESTEDRTTSYNYSDVSEFASLVSDAAVAARMCQRYAGGIGKHSHEDTLCAYNPKTGLWRVSDAQVYSRVRFVLSDMIREEGVLKGFYDKKGQFAEDLFEGFKEKMFSSRKHDSVCKILKNTPGIEIDGARFNADSQLLHMDDGVLDIRNGELKRHDKEHLMTFSCGYGFGDAVGGLRKIREYMQVDSRGVWKDGNLWQQFLYEIMDGDLEMCAYLQQVLGYVLCGENPHELMFFLYGTGSNGKTIFIETACRLLGSYSFAVPISIFLENTRENKASIVAQLPGKRLISTSEIGKDKAWDEQVIKDLSGGDKINARQLFERSFEYQPGFKTLVRGNHKPIIKGCDLGIWRRIVLLPFEVTISEAKKDVRLKQKFFREEMLREVLLWAVAGYWRYREHGFLIPEKVEEAKSDYKMEMNPLPGFVSEYFEECVEYRSGMRCEEILAVYNVWRVDLGQEKLTVVSLGRRLADVGVKSKVVEIEGKSVRMYNLRLRIEKSKEVKARRNVINLH